MFVGFLGYRSKGCAIMIVPALLLAIGQLTLRLSSGTRLRSYRAGAVSERLGTISDFSAGNSTVHLTPAVQVFLT